MAQLEITTEFDNRVFVPGDTIRGKVSWQTTTGEAPAGAVELRLFYYTSGKGTRDVAIVDSIAFDLPAASDQRDFEFKLPEGPYSFSGKLVSLIWGLELQVGDGGAVEGIDLTVSPTGEEINLYAHDDGNLPKHSDFAIGAMKRKIRTQ